MNRALVWAALVAATLGAAPRARAEEPSRAAMRTDRRVIVFVRSSSEDSAALDTSLRELLQRIGSDLEVRRVERVDLDAQAPPTLALVWVDMSGTGDATITIADGHTRRVLVRRGVERRGSAGLMVEAVAHVVQSSVEEVVVPQAPPAPPVTPAPVPAPEAAPPPTPGPPPAAPPPTTASSEAASPAATPSSAPNASAPTSTEHDVVAPAEPPIDGWALDLGGRFVGRSFGGGSNLVIGGGGTVTIDKGRENFRPALLLSGEYHVAFDVPGDLVLVHTQVLSLRLVPTLRLAGKDAWFVDCGLGGGFDTFFTSPRSNDLPATSLTGDRKDVAPVATALLAGHYAVARSADLVLALSLDGDMAPRRFVSDAAGTHQSVFAPTRFRPALAFGFTFGVVGPAPYPSVGGSAGGAR